MFTAVSQLILMLIFLPVPMGLKKGDPFGIALKLFNKLFNLA